MKVTFHKNRIVRVDGEYVGDIAGHPGNYYFQPAGLGLPLGTIGGCYDSKIRRVKQNIWNKAAVMNHADYELEVVVK